MNDTIQQLKQRATQVRRNVLLEARGKGEGYVGQGLGSADMLTALYFHEMRYDPQDPEWPQDEDRDRFLLSAGHYSIVLWATLTAVGLYPEEMLASYGAVRARSSSRQRRLNPPGGRDVDSIVAAATEEFSHAPPALKRRPTLKPSLPRRRKGPYCGQKMWVMTSFPTCPNDCRGELMQALVKYQSGPGNVELREMPEPSCGDNQLKIEVAWCGVCGADLHVLHDTCRNYPPVILGHEFSGTVVEAGKSADRSRIGERVTIFPAMAVTCGKCIYCRRARSCFVPNGAEWGTASTARSPNTPSSSRSRLTGCPKDLRLTKRRSASLSPRVCRP